MSIPGPTPSLPNVDIHQQLNEKNDGKCKKKGKDSKNRARQQVDDVARKYGLDRNGFRKYVERSKRAVGRGPGDNYTYSGLEDLAGEYKGS